MASDNMAEILTRLDVLEAAKGARTGGGQCSAANPHDTLSWDRRRYLCRCGKIYAKDGLGALREV